LIAAVLVSGKDPATFVNFRLAVDGFSASLAVAVHDLSESLGIVDRSCEYQRLTLSRLAHRRIGNSEQVLLDLHDRVQLALIQVASCGLHAGQVEPSDLDTRANYVAQVAVPDCVLDFVEVRHRIEDLPHGLLVGAIWRRRESTDFGIAEVVEHPLVGRCG
jgi:hypothetical protein